MAAQVVAAEVATLYYALLARGAAAPARADAVVFAHDTSQSAATTWGFGLAVVVETVAVHFWLVRAHTVGVRAGLRLTARVSLAVVADVEEISWRNVPRPAPGYLDAARPGTPNVVLTLGRPAAVTGPLGLRRTVTRIGLRLADPAGFVAALRRARGPN